MIVAGLLLKSNDIRMVALSGSRERHELIAPKVNKLSLLKNPTQADVAQLVKDVQIYCQAHGVDKIVINRRATTGQGAGGAGTFLIEGILLAVANVEVVFIHPATLRATDKRENERKALQPKTQDLAKAYDLAYEGLL
ncbi:DUF3010 family protein [Shewanella surugensis]|uniref:DUF3010 family protein n=1 Tax=Shewanella surugensis TaxID=212020 RepID=A0ABT0L9Y0_9GAMM|nr:DUF3010 family protein [Shewanella surugensis]MCL1124290.1 DUF3010 family protein [Shewanella surugensis]